MVNTLKQRKQAGFTIIEVMIVLAIAAMILLVVLLAVPNLQRNSRNTQIRQAASTLTGYFGEYASNNGGAAPGSFYYDKATGNVCMIASTTAPTACADNTATGYVGKIQAGYTVSAGTTQPTAAGTLVVATGYTCNAGALSASSSRAVAVAYESETANGVANQCVGS